MVVCLERGADGLHMVQLMPLPSQNLMTRFTFLVPANRGCTGKAAVKRVYTVSQKKQDTKLLPITSPNINRFSKYFHCRTQ